MRRRFALIVNPAAAGGRPLAVLPKVKGELDRLGVEHRTVQSLGVDHVRREAAAAAAVGEVVAALGGDGLLRPLAGALRGSDGALAIVPCGRGNDFARVLGLPRDPVAAVRVAVGGRERLVDVAEVDGVPYVGIASLGFDSDANRIANEARLIPGNLVYLYAGLRTLAGWQPATFSVTVDGERYDLTGYSVAVGNSKAYGGGMFLLPHAELDDGQLDVLMVERHPKVRFLATLPKVFRGTHLPSRYAHVLRGRVVEVDADRPFDVYADGDPIGATPATMRVERRSLRVIVPA